MPTLFSVWVTMATMLLSATALLGTSRQRSVGTPNVTVTVPRTCALGHAVHAGQRLVTVPSLCDNETDVLCKSCFGEYFNVVCFLHMYT